VTEAVLYVQVNPHRDPGVEAFTAGSGRESAGGLCDPGVLLAESVVRDVSRLLNVKPVPKIRWLAEVPEADADRYRGIFTHRRDDCRINGTAWTDRGEIGLNVRLLGTNPLELVQTSAHETFHTAYPPAVGYLAEVEPAARNFAAAYALRFGEVTLAALRGRRNYRATAPMVRWAVLATTF